MVFVATWSTSTACSLQGRPSPSLSPPALLPVERFRDSNIEPRSGRSQNSQGILGWSVLMSLLDGTTEWTKQAKTPRVSPWFNSSSTSIRAADPVNPADEEDLDEEFDDTEDDEFTELPDDSLDDPDNIDIESDLDELDDYEEESDLFEDDEDLEGDFGSDAFDDGFEDDDFAEDGEES